MDKTTIAAAAIAGILTTSVVGAAFYNAGTAEPEQTEVRQVQEVQEVSDTVAEEPEALEDEGVESESAEPADGAVEVPTAPIVTTPTPKSAPVQAPAPVPEPAPAPSCYCPSADVDCPDLGSRSNAQAVFNCCMDKYGYDYHRLDRDSDGLACESN